jgi:hypothetical protein
MPPSEHVIHLPRAAGASDRVFKAQRFTILRTTSSPKERFLSMLRRTCAALRSSIGRFSIAIQFRGRATGQGDNSGQSSPRSAAELLQSQFFVRRTSFARSGLDST